jgi:hypothetical protein
MRAWASRKWLSTKNRSPRRSTPRHPITIASTAKPPDPMTCALAVILLPESRAHGCHTQKTVFPGPAIRVHNCVRTRAVPACGVCSCGVGELRESGQLHGCRGAVHDTVHGLLLLVGSRSQQGARVESVCGWTRGGLVDTVSSRGEGSGMRGRLGWCCVRWLFQGCCLGGRLRCRAAAAWRAGGGMRVFITNVKGTFLGMSESEEASKRR